MQLGDLLDDLTLDARTGSVEVRDVQIDSRECGPGSLFFALPGTSAHGAAFAHDAVDRGAVAIVTSEPIATDVPVVVVPASQLRALVAEASAALVGHPEFGVELVGVTGTNGKTTVTSIVADLSRAIEWNGASVGTLTQERTTPAGPELYRIIRHLVDGFDARRPRSVIAVEVSSHALDQGRVDGLRFAVAVFTNLSHEHLDYHETMEQYFKTKAALFTPERAQRAVVWGDDEHGSRLASLTSLPVTLVGRHDARDVVTSLLGTTFFWRDQLVSTPLVGGYNVDNALIAMTVLAALGAPDDDVAWGMANVATVPGRFEVVAAGAVTVIVDYAHTPDGLRRLLGDVRALAPLARVATVFGCGGDRDREKRPAMGTAATALSDLTVVTSDNPRTEAPGVIIDAVMTGADPGATVWRVEDRREAIGDALRWARPGDVVVIAGKGHETNQIFADRNVPFDDRVVARELLGSTC